MHGLGPLNLLFWGNWNENEEKWREKWRKIKSKETGSKFFQIPQSIDRNGPPPSLIDNFIIQRIVHIWGNVHEGKWRRLSLWDLKNFKFHIGRFSFLIFPCFSFIANQNEGKMMEKWRKVKANWTKNEDSRTFCLIHFSDRRFSEREKFRKDKFPTTKLKKRRKWKKMARNISKFYCL